MSDTEKAQFDFTKTRELAAEYASRFDADNGDSAAEYAEMASLEVFPAGQKHVSVARAEFRGLVRAAIKELEHN